MSRKRIKGTKYNRVTKQQKYIFLKLCITENLSIHQAAFHSGIHYSTAKTILFFHKNQYKNYTSYVISELEPKGPENQPPRAAYKSVPINFESSATRSPCIQIISRSYQPSKKRARKHKSQQRDGMKEENDSNYVKMEDEIAANKFQDYQLEQKQKGELTDVKVEQQPVKSENQNQIQDLVLRFQ